MGHGHGDGREQRRVRFASIDELSRSEIGLAAEIWLRDAIVARWGTRESMRLAAHLTRYMRSGDAKLLQLGRIEHLLQITRDEITMALRLLETFQLVEAHSIEKDELRCALHLSRLQFLEVLDTRRRLDDYARGSPPAQPSAGRRWWPSPAQTGVTGDRVGEDTGAFNDR